MPANVRDAGDTGSLPGSGRSPGEGNGHPLQYSCLDNLMDRGAWWDTVHGVTESDATERACTETHEMITIVSLVNIHTQLQNVFSCEENF